MFDKKNWEYAFDYVDIKYIIYILLSCVLYCKWVKYGIKINENCNNFKYDHSSTKLN